MTTSNQIELSHVVVIADHVPPRIVIGHAEQVAGLDAKPVLGHVELKQQVPFDNYVITLTVLMSYKHCLSPVKIAGQGGVQWPAGGSMPLPEKFHFFIWKLCVWGHFAHCYLIRGPTCVL